uniref:Secreted protein n=1 Tax=Cacopsylla melanoneura TaxID=428564 RepID=A0A8D8X3X9_9HEMI
MKIALYFYILLLLNPTSVVPVGYKQALKNMVLFFSFFFSSPSCCSLSFFNLQCCGTPVIKLRKEKRLTLKEVRRSRSKPKIMIYSYYLISFFLSNFLYQKF